MEERIPMKLSPRAALAGLLWLAGCATTGSESPRPVRLHLPPQAPAAAATRARARTGASTARRP
jgi:hypothetical protein